MSKASSPLVDIFGFPATLVHGDATVIDRWRWLCRHLPKTANGERLLEVGCGSGAFTIGAAKRGYQALGLSWSEPDLEKASARAAACNVGDRASFVVKDARELDRQPEFAGQFDVVICCEVIEHILDDLRLMQSIFGCLKPGGRLLLTAPNLEYRAITPGDNGPFSTEENGWHVRRGYTHAMLLELCHRSDFIAEEIAYCSGIVSQLICKLWRESAKIDTRLGWLSVLPFRPLPLLFDRPLGWLLHWPAYSICLVAYRPRFAADLTKKPTLL